MTEKKGKVNDVIKADLTDGSTDIKSLPTFEKTKSHISWLPGLLFQLADGRIVAGFAQRFNRDFNGIHIQQKEGDIIYSSNDNVLLVNVIGFKDLNHEII